MVLSVRSDLLNEYVVFSPLIRSTINRISFEILGLTLFLCVSKSFTFEFRLVDYVSISSYYTDECHIHDNLVIVFESLELKVTDTSILIELCRLEDLLLTDHEDDFITTLERISVTDLVLHHSLLLVSANNIRVCRRADSFCLS